MTPVATPLSEATSDLMWTLALSAGGITVVILLIGVLIVAVLVDAASQLRRIGDQLHALQQEGIDVHVGPGTLGRSALDAEQLVRGAGYLVTLLRKVVKREGEAIPDADRLTLELGKAMGVPLPTRDDAVSITPRGATIKSGLLPYGSKPIPARLEPEAV